MYALIRYHIASLFSFRALQTNAHAARTLPCPTPAAVKLAILAKLIERDGAEVAQSTLDWLAPLEILWDPPQRAAISATTVRVWKDDNGKLPLIPTAAMREYLHAERDFGIAIGSIEEARRNDLAFALEQIRALGNAESLVQPRGPVRWLTEAPEEWVRLDARATAAEAGEVAVVIDDLGHAPSWDRLNVYRDHDAKLIPHLVPIQATSLESDK